MAMPATRRFAECMYSSPSRDMHMADGDRVAGRAADSGTDQVGKCRMAMEHISRGPESRMLHDLDSPPDHFCMINFWVQAQEAPPPHPG
jgi:hypothetical protein